VKGTIRPWGETLASDLEALSGPFHLILIGPGPVQVHLSEDMSQHRCRLVEAEKRYGRSILFHLFSTDAEFRYDQGVGYSLTIGPEGPYDLVERDYFLLTDRHRTPGALAIAGLAPTGRVKVQEFVSGGHVIDFKLQALF